MTGTILDKDGEWYFVRFAMAGVHSYRWLASPEQFDIGQVVVLENDVLQLAAAKGVRRVSHA